MSSPAFHLEISHQPSGIVRLQISDFTVLDFTMPFSSSADNPEARA
jgi:hypothetical protein